MLEKIVSGGQTGADRAALDFALKFNIDHGGWVPRGRRTEAGPLPLRYELCETGTTDYRDRTRRNILDSDGTLIVYRGQLKGGSLLTCTIAQEAEKPLCLLDLMSVEEFEAGVILKSFIQDNETRVLNVAGPRFSHDPWIYQDVRTLLEVMLYMFFFEQEKDKSMPEWEGKALLPEQFPATIDEAADLICTDLPFRIRAYIARTDPGNISDLYFTLMDYIRHRVGFDSGNPALIQDYGMQIQSDSDPDPGDAVMAVLKQLKASLEQDYALRIVK